VTVDDRRTIDRPTPVPSNSCVLCRRLKHAEQSVGIFHVEARAIVAHEIDCFVALSVGADFYAGGCDGE